MAKDTEKPEGSLKDKGKVKYPLPEIELREPFYLDVDLQAEYRISQKRQSGNPSRKSKTIPTN